MFLQDGEANCAPTDRVFLKDGCPWQCGDDESGVCPRVKSSGCFCDRTKIGKVLYNGKCIDPIGCPCVHKGKEYSVSFFLAFAPCVYMHVQAVVVRSHYNMKYVNQIFVTCNETLEIYNTKK